jgi:hypothetical protein
MFNEYIYKNQFVTEIDTHANLLNKIKGKIFYTGLSDHLLPILSSSKKIVFIFHDIMHGSDISWRILQKNLWKTQWNLISGMYILKIL